jgi:uncharacterized membrane protein YedE/YeeE
MEGMPGFIVGLSGLSIGAILGFVIRRAKLCTFAAIEDATVGGDTRRLKAFAVALAIAILGTQPLIVLDLFDPRTTPYVPAAWPWLAAMLGGFLFGIGMALVGTCAFGSLVRMGGGDLRSLVVLLVFGLVAYATVRGISASVRIELLDRTALPLPWVRQGDLPGIANLSTSFDTRPGLSIAIAGLLLLWATNDRRLWRARRLLAAGMVFGICIVAGWVSTAILPDPLDADIRPQSLNFVAPVGRAIIIGIQGQGSLVDFGVASVVGAVIGAGAAAWSAGEFRWDAFDDQREMRRHLLGAVLMGFGGVIAGGCTIGQGLTAASLLSPSAPMAIVGMLFGARVVIFFLVEGAASKALLNAACLETHVDRWRGRRS